MKNQNLIQHENSHKFSTDALLLAQFPSLEKVNTFAELGTGCGIISLEMLKRKAQMKAIAIDFNDELLQTAKENAKIYTLESQIDFVNEDLNNFPNVSHSITKEYKNSCELIVCNPPWLLKNQGKLPKDSMKLNALFGDEKTYKLFFDGARYFIKERGFLSLVTIPQRLEEVFSELKSSQFVIRKIQHVHKDSNSPAIFTLISAQFLGKSLKSTISNLEVSAPLFL